MEPPSRTPPGLPKKGSIEGSPKLQAGPPRQPPEVIRTPKLENIENGIFGVIKNHCLLVVNANEMDR